MIKGMTISDFQRELERQDFAKNDYVSSARSLMMSSDDMLTVGSGAYSLTQTASQQLSTFCNIPYNYYKKCGEIPGLREQNVNKWLDRSKSRRMVRTLDGKARAFLSNKYKPLDHLLIMDAAAPVLSEFPGLAVKTANLTDDRMYMQFMFPKLQAEIVKGDVVQAGLCLTNSEVGRGAVDIQLMVWRLACTNGMIAKSVLRKNHVGKRIEADMDDYAIYSSETIRADLNAFRLKTRDVLKNALTEASWISLISNLKNKAGQSVESPEAAIENVTKRYSLTQGERDSVFGSYINGGMSTRWGLSNALTDTAKSCKSPDRAYDLEKAGWDLSNVEDAVFEKMVSA